ncbi:GlxA family transcriptional regulator [Nesterenkonia alba]|uniref:GlxA family transcriptional regulator n=1 Tax=Nesterenkonia alba TaxID=515814 RepID=UPI0003B7A371|nr:helix-turn-helix domain-containing protein [Nesterenkonia alba]
MHTIVVLALQDTIGFDLASAVETFRHARLPDGRQAYRVLVCGEAPEVSAGAFALRVEHGLESLRQADTVMVPGRHDPLAPTSPAVVEALQQAAADTTRLASICVGAFSLAEAGLLDGLRATTHWAATQALSQCYPKIEVDPDVLYVDNGQILTSAGAAAGIDLCLHMIQRDYGAAVAADASRRAVAPLHQSGGQAQFILRNQPTSSTQLPDASLEPTLQWIEENAHQNITLEDVAEVAHMSVRTLNRRFHAETGQPPMVWLTGVRIRHAQELLETTDDGVERIARQAGFPSPSNFRANFRKMVGVSPSDYRRTFR